jgi:hypothetical protein
MSWITNIFCKKNRQLLLDIILIIIPIILIYVYFNLKTGDTKQTYSDNKHIEEKIDSVKVYNEFISEKIVELEQNQEVFNEIITKNNELINENNKELSKLKRAYNDKIKTVSNYNVAQLDSFFAKRYKEYYNR